MCDTTSEMLFVTYRSLTCTHVQPMDVVQNDSKHSIPPSNVDILCYHKSESENIEQEQDGNK